MNPEKMTEEEQIAAMFHASDFHIVQTGGGCEAWRHDQENGDYILITTDDGVNIPTKFKDDCIVGLYNPDDEALYSWEASDVSKAFYTAVYVVREHYMNSEYPEQ